MTKSHLVSEQGNRPFASARLSRVLGANVARLRKEQALSKKALALLCGMSRPYLDIIESGESDARLSCVQRLADALCVTPAELFIDD